MIIYPAVDIKEGRAVRLRQGDPDRETVFSVDPVETARVWAAQGAQALHVVDLDGAFAGQPKNLKLLEAIVSATGLPVQFGGGLRSRSDIEAALSAGATRVVVGTRALDEEFFAGILSVFPGRVIPGLDSRGGRVAVHGWQSASDVTTLEAARLLRKLGAHEVIYTDIARDGMLQGPDTDGIKALLEDGTRVVASGGVTTVQDLIRLAALCPLGLTGAIVGRALYDGTISLPAAQSAVGGPAVSEGDT